MSNKKSGLLPTIITLVIGSLLLLVMGVMLLTSLMKNGSDLEQSMEGSVSGEVSYNGEFSKDLPKVTGVKGQYNVTDEVATLSVATAIKYKLLPSVIISQYAYESMWGKSQSAVNDINFFGITWYQDCGFPKGSSRGIGGSEGGNYIKFPDKESCFSFYGHMVAKQKNFNQCVGNKDPGACLLILGRGGYAAAGITESSPYYSGCMAIIRANKLTEYDEFAIKHWDSYKNQSSGNKGNSKGNSDIPTVARSMIGYFGYLQDHRESLIGSAQNPDRNGQTDCSGFVWVVLTKAGYRTPADMQWNTSTMESDSKGPQTYLKGVSQNDAKAGDVITINSGVGVGDAGHTAILLENWKGNETKCIQHGDSRGVNETTVSNAFARFFGGYWGPYRTTFGRAQK